MKENNDIIGTSMDSWKNIHDNESGGMTAYAETDYIYSEWFHMVAVFDAVQSVNIYINGVLVEHHDK